MFSHAIRGDTTVELARTLPLYVCFVTSSGTPGKRGETEVTGPVALSYVTSYSVGQYTPGIWASAFRISSRGGLAPEAPVAALKPELKRRKCAALSIHHDAFCGQRPSNDGRLHGLTKTRWRRRLLSRAFEEIAKQILAVAEKHNVEEHCIRLRVALHSGRGGYPALSLLASGATRRAQRRAQSLWENERRRAGGREGGGLRTVSTPPPPNTIGSSSVLSSARSGTESRSRSVRTLA